MKRRGFLIGLSGALWAVPVAAQMTQSGGALRLRFVSDEADAVLRLLDDRMHGPPPPADWAAVFAS